MDGSRNNESYQSTDDRNNQEPSRMFISDISMVLESPMVTEILNAQPIRWGPMAVAPDASVPASPLPNLNDEYMGILADIVNHFPQRRIQGTSAAEIAQQGQSDGSMAILRRVEETLDAITGVGSSNTRSSLPNEDMILADPSMLSRGRPEDDDLDHLLDTMDIDNMTYEELLNLGENMGNVNTGLTSDSIYDNLQGFKICPRCFPKRREICSICQEEYKRGESVGVLDCGHEFHQLCIIEWLFESNSCPICRARGLDV